MYLRKPQQAGYLWELRQKRPQVTSENHEQTKRYSAVEVLFIMDLAGNNRLLRKTIGFLNDLQKNLFFYLA